jgi:hypothetical protein
MAASSSSHQAPAAPPAACCFNPQALFDGIAGLRKSAGKGDIKATKQQYVAVVGSLQKWADAAGVAGNLKGL